jgi:peptidyl-prolyl cis-trans isomerase B (cyclophilin B)
MSKRAYERRIQAKREREKAARKRAERMRKLRIWISATVAVALAVTLFLVFDPLGEDTKPVATGSGSPIAGCTGPTPNAPQSKQYPAPPAMSIDTKDTIYVATMKTSCGDVKIAMDPQTAPTTVNNFVFLARDGFYNGTRFHRVQSETDFAIVQGGDPKGDGTGGPGYDYPGEKPPAGTQYKKGTIAMANSGDPSSNGSQFFIVVRDWEGLPANYTVFGQVIDEGDSFGTLTRMINAKGPPLPNGLGIRPEPPIFILNVVIEETARG